MQTNKPLLVRNAYWTVAGLIATAILVACGGGDGPATELPAAANSFKLPHSGITSSQCYQSGSDNLVDCNNPEAIALSGVGKQDGMNANVNAMSYSDVQGYSREECVKDNVTGLVWEGKTTSGLRAGGNTYTNYDSSTEAQKYTDGGTLVPPTLEEVNAATNTVGYIAYVNSVALCGYTNWRLPTVEELQTIVDYGKPSPGPSLQTNWFVNTPSGAYWSRSSYSGDLNLAWYINFDFNGRVAYDGSRDSTLSVRLVRNSP